MSQLNLAGFPGVPVPPIVVFPFWGQKHVPQWEVEDWSADIFGSNLYQEIAWEQYEIIMYERRMLRPRLECWFSETDRRYTFGGGQAIQPKPMPPSVTGVRDALTEFLGVRFDSCFANFYPDGDSSIAWHADDEPWIGPTIASVSLGESRRFLMKPKGGGPLHKLTLHDGDLLVMKDGCQDGWMHSLPKTKRPVGSRLNLTFRTTR